MNTHILANTMNRRLNSCDNRPTLKASTRKVQTFNPFILIIPDIKLQSNDQPKVHLRFCNMVIIFTTAILISIPQKDKENFSFKKDSSWQKKYNKFSLLTSALMYCCKMPIISDHILILRNIILRRYNLKSISYQTIY